MSALNPLPDTALPRVAVPRVIDMHGHCGAPDAEALLDGRPERLAEFQAQAAGTGAASMAHNRAVMLPAAGARMASLDKRLADLDLMGIDLQVVSPSPHLYAYWADPALANDLVAATNAAVAALVARAPERLAGMGMVAMQHPDLAADQIRQARATGLKGIEISASVGARELSDPDFDPVWHAAEETGLPVFIHPLGTSLGSRLSSFYLSNTIGQPLETTIALSSLIISGVLDRFPGLKLIGAHGGGYLPAYIGRLDHTWRVRPEARQCRERPSDYLSRIWVDTVVFDPEQLRSLVARMGAGRILFGTDYPFDMADCRPDTLAEALPAHDRAAIMGGNAEALFSL
ncbi:amidohydrolase [Rhodobacter sp. NTK016B]|uniref:amidohydrolase family protein n=1 Tax=Rhodobacter sp. NTK016B TaxID=2759676 RepID=UPI001A8E60FF|nr:amidohydrolase family protein [Rhodobacter sp. NTK016B]MBN8292425.1 amidohydrolase [Rhodobacter sp. NTK016B]